MVSRLSSEEILHFLVIVTILLASARFMGEVFKKLKLPAVMGELFAGILLGPSLFGAFFPHYFEKLFVEPRESFAAFDGLARIGIILLMFVAGMEIDLQSIKRRGKGAAKISFSGILFPFAVGFAATWFLHDELFSITDEKQLAASLFMGTALSITALSVMAKILIDMSLLKTRFGNMMMTAAMIDDFVGWMLFSVVINVANLQQESFLHSWQVMIIVIGLTVFLLTVGRYAVDKGFVFSNKYLTTTGGSLSLAIVLCLCCAIFTQWIGINAIFGAFLMGIAVGASKNFSERTKEMLHDIVTYIFAPLFFVSIGLRVNFITSFDWQICLFILAISVFGKLLGGTLGARLSGFKINKAFAIGFGMNARGSQEIVLGLLALQAKIIDEEIFVGLVVMTFVTIMMAGPAIKYFLKRHEAIHGTPDNREKMPVTS